MIRVHPSSKNILVTSHNFVAQWDLSNGLLSDPNADCIQKLRPKEVGVPIYNFQINRIVGDS